MPFFDRYWWLRAVGSVLAGVPALVFPWRFLALALPLDKPSGSTSEHDILTALGLTAALALLALVLGVSTHQARRRNIWRTDILEGRERQEYPDAHKYQPPLPAHTHAPFVLTWHVSKSKRVFGVLAVLPVTLLGCIGLATCGLLVQAFAVILAGDTRNFPPFHATIVSFAVICPCCLICFSMFGSWMVEGFGASPSIAVDQHGITWHTRWRKSRTMRWGEALLLEYGKLRQLNGYTTSIFKRYTLYGRQAVIRWSDEPSREATRLQREQLLAVIYHHTGMLPMQLVQGFGARRQADSDHSVRGT